jgi:predicted phage-related endonuclease
VSRAFKEGRSRAKYLKDNFLDTKVSLPDHSAPSIMRRLGQERAAKEKERRFKEYEAAVKRSVKQGVKPPKKPRGYRPTNKE